MPPYYPNQQGNQYSNNDPYFDQFGQYQNGFHPADQYNHPQNPMHQYNHPQNPMQIQMNIPPQQTNIQPHQGQQYQYQYQHPQSPSQHQHNPAAYQQMQIQGYQPTFQPQQQTLHQYPQQYYPQQISQQQVLHHQSQAFQHQAQTQPHLQPPSKPHIESRPQSGPLSTPLSHFQPQQHFQTSPVQQPASVPLPRVLQDVQPNVARQQPQPAKPPQDRSTDQPEPDYAILLLCLADEYLEAASKSSARSDEYFKLVATALGCIESVLTNFNLPPLREAQVSLRYAQILHNETENNDNAETVLTKTIELCERMKFVDLGYAAQLLLGQVLYGSNAKAANKHVQSIIQDVETYRHSAWEYAFRLQLVNFFMVSGLPSDVHAAVVQLERLGYSAKQNGDNTIYAFAAILETLANLQSSHTDSLQAAQRSLAKARAMQLNDDVAGSPQMMIMMEFLDLCMHIKDSDVAQGEPKRKLMQSVLYSALESPNWRNDGVLYLPVTHAALRGLQIQDSGIITEKHGKYFLALSWLPKDEVEDLGYLLSGVSAAFKNAGDNGKAEKFFDEGLDLLREMEKEKQSVNCKADIVRDRRLVVEIHFLFERIFLQCSKGQWERAKSTLAGIETAISSLEGDSPSEMNFLLDYVKGCVAQGLGNIDEALNIFAQQVRRLYPQASPTPSRGSTSQRREDVYKGISILSAMNTIFIIQDESHPQHHRLQQLVNLLDALVHNVPNKLVLAAWNFILAILPSNTILKTKQFLSYALNAAQAINNAQVTTLCLTAMHDKFFKGVIGDQAIKCARAATYQAKKLNDPLWISVTTGLEAHGLSNHGMNEEAARKREEFERASRLLPISVQRRNQAT